MKYEWETEEEFEENVGFLREIGFARAHVFAYSKRGGTIAAALPNQVEATEKERRAKIMAAAAADCEEAFLSTQVGKEVTVLFETFEEDENEGYTENYTRIKVLSSEDLSGKILRAKIIKSHKDFCVAELI